ncbi:MAG TPA: helix-turn-helix transcriptional regulator [Gaiellaceae bacterium]|nr:helix-turn-helix transcriptional regulator [Gaiellaceae bacterium]
MRAPLATPHARRARARILELSDDGHVTQGFLAQLSAELRVLVPFDGAFWSGADPLTSLATSPARIESLADVPDMCRIWWECEFLVEDFLRFSDLARAPRPSGSLCRATDGRPARSSRFRAVHQALGYRDELRAVFRTAAGAWGLVSLWRGEDAPPFTPAEERLLSDLSEAVAQPFRRAALLRAVSAAEGADAPGLLTFDAGGTLEALNEQAKAWLAELPEPVRIGGRAPLPTALLTVSARARAIAAGFELGVAQARIQTRSGRWLVVHGFALHGADGGSGRTALVIEPAPASQVAPIIAGAYLLTPREQQIARMVSYGLSAAEIAARLHLSRHTVRDYLKQVFEKVGVSSRGELVARIFSDHYERPLHEALAHGPASDAVA